MNAKPFVLGLLIFMATAVGLAQSPGWRISKISTDGRELDMVKGSDGWVEYDVLRDNVAQKVKDNWQVGDQISIGIAGSDSRCQDKHEPSILENETRNDFICTAFGEGGVGGVSRIVPSGDNNCYSDVAVYLTDRDPADTHSPFCFSGSAATMVRDYWQVGDRITVRSGGKLSGCGDGNRALYNERTGQWVCNDWGPAGIF